MTVLQFAEWTELLFQVEIAIVGANAMLSIQSAR